MFSKDPSYCKWPKVLKRIYLRYVDNYISTSFPWAGVLYWLGRLRKSGPPKKVMAMDFAAWIFRTFRCWWGFLVLCTISCNLVTIVELWSWTFFSSIWKRRSKSWICWMNPKGPWKEILLYMSDSFDLVKWRVVLGRTLVCRKHHI